MNKVKALLELSRIDHGLMVVIAIIAGVISSSGLKALTSTRTLIACIAGLLVEIGVFTFNDVFNVEEDRINSPQRPIPSGEITVKEATVYGSTALVLAVAVSLLAGLESLAIILLAIIVGMLYNAKIKKYGIYGNLCVALSTAFPFIYGAVVALRSFWAVPIRCWMFFAMAFLATWSREIIKGIVDVEGDRRVGIKTLPIVLGEKASAKIALIIMLSAIVLSLVAIPFVLNQVNYVFIVFIADILLLYSVFSTLQNPTRQTARRAKNMALIGMSVGLAAFIAGSV